MSDIRRLLLDDQYAWLVGRAKASGQTQRGLFRSIVQERMLTRRGALHWQEGEHLGIASWNSERNWYDGQAFKGDELVGEFHGKTPARAWDNFCRCIGMHPEIKGLSSRQKQIVEYRREHTREETMERFRIPLGVLKDHEKIIRLLREKVE